MAQRHDWYITIISTGQRYRIEPGDSVVIGRTPLRPGTLPKEQAKRLSIPDPERSLSKRHLLLQLDENGVASIEDLASTNGSYVVRSDNRLIRIPAHRLFQLDQSPVRLQLGDIGLELTRHELPVAVKTTSSADLFAHTGENTMPSDLGSGVDDIVAAREGEPTNMFDAKKVRASVQSMNENAGSGVDADASSTSASSTSQTPTADSSTSDSQIADSPASASPTSAATSSEKSAEKSAENTPERSGSTHENAPAGSTGFEPGSVFDRLTRGQMKDENDVHVEVDGLTSEEARTSTDHDQQFQMARHRELLPFLATNPYLYHELYAWLSSIPDPVIQAALDHNPGYHAANGKDAK